MPKEKEAKETKEEGRYVIEDIPTQSIPVIKDTQTDEQMDSMQALAKVLENQNEILKLAKE